jgi:hypothetical protein
MLVAAGALVAVFAGTGRVEWQLVALALVLWSAYGFLDSLLGGVVEPVGPFLRSALGGGATPVDSGLTIEPEAAPLNRRLEAEPRRPRTA